MEANAIDISSYQGQAFNFPELMKYGITKISVKVTEGSANGSAYVNPYAQWALTNANQAGMVICPYHFLRSVSVQDAVDEANFFLANIKAMGVWTDCPIMLDVEDASLLNYANLKDMINAWFNTLANAGYTNQLVYGSLSWFQAGYINRFDYDTQPKSWIAMYPSNPQHNQRPLVCDVWQFASDWGTYFPKGYWGGSGLDVNYDYTDAISYTKHEEATSEPEQPKEETTTTTQEPEVVEVEQPEMAWWTRGILTFYEDTTLNDGKNYPKGSSWNISQDPDKGKYYLNNDVYVDTNKAEQQHIYIQPNPYVQSDPETLKGLAIIPKFNPGWGNGILVYAKPFSRLEPVKNVVYATPPEGAYIPEGHTLEDSNNMFFIYRESNAFRVTDVKVMDKGEKADNGDDLERVWAEIGENMWVALDYMNIAIGI